MATLEEINYLYHHIVLPPKLPSGDDRDASHDKFLLEEASHALKEMKTVVKREHVKIVKAAIDTVDNMLYARDAHGNVGELQLLDLFETLTAKTTTGHVPIEVHAQNAGIVISRNRSIIQFEFFELSPLNEPSMQSGRLVRTFPGSTASIPITAMKDMNLQTSLARTIVKMTTQKAPGFQPQVKKSGAMLDEERDTTHPGLVTDFLLNMVAAVGSLSDSVRIKKNTREEVMWNNAFNSWRRTPTWLLLRVSLQLLFSCKRDLSTPSSGTLYKAFTMTMLSRILELANNRFKDLGSEMLYITSAKLIRRLRKLELLSQTDYLGSQWAHSIELCIGKVSSSMNERWQNLLDCSHADIGIFRACSLPAALNLNMGLRALDSFLDDIHARKHDASFSAFNPRGYYHDLPGDELPNVKYVMHTSSLLAFEKWVDQNLQSWILLHQKEEDTCRQLRSLMKAYHTTAKKAYYELKISTSVMYLTLLELWVACDISACALYSLLPEYDHEICILELEWLVLPMKRQMIRLHNVETHIEERREKARRNKLPSVYRQFGDAKSFAVRYFNRSHQLQDTLSKIERDAVKEEAQKWAELRDVQHQYSDLMNRYRNTTCETSTVTFQDSYGETQTRSQHKNSCSRCKLQREASELSIDIFEWPLSSDASKAKATVFELEIPQAYSDWRDASYFLITTVLRHEETNAKEPIWEFTLNQDDRLRSFLSDKYSDRRIVPFSEIKPHKRTHRKTLKGVSGLTEKMVSLENALRYQYFDATQYRFVGPELRCTKKVLEACMYTMPAHSKELNCYLREPNLSENGLHPNVAISKAPVCPEHMTIDEYTALCSLPYGCEAFGLNILGQLANPVVDFNKLETQLLITQCTYQVGKLTDYLERSRHRIFTDVAFGEAMIRQLELALKRVAGNWESWRACGSFSLLARRVMSFSATSMLCQSTLTYLAELRQVTFRWVNHLKERASLMTDGTQRTLLYSRATEVALVCISTFDIEDTHVKKVLRQDSAVSTLLQCSFLVEENYESVLPDDEFQYEQMLCSWKSLMFRMLPELRDHIIQNPEQLCEAVAMYWTSFQPSGPHSWKILEQPHDQWLQMSSSGNIPVHCNLLTGQLLVDGQPLIGLPSEYTQDPVYKLLFKDMKLEVVPSDELGMKFSAKSRYNGHNIHFGMKDEVMLVLATAENSRFELVPSYLLHGRLPRAFVTDNLLWFDHTKDEVIFRDRKTPWFSDAGGYRLTHDKSGNTWQLSNGSTILMDMASHSVRRLSKLFSAVAIAKDIHITFDTITHRIDIELPRLHLKFFFQPDGTRIASHQYRGMILDNDQGVDTLQGLSSKLVLKSEDSDQERLILIPVPRVFDKSSISYAMANGSCAMTVTINKDDADRVYAYSLDTTLGRILGTGDLQSWLFLCYLHGLTSHCLPDPLTRHTGTESALKILNSAAVRSFDLLTPSNVDLLKLIAKLSPMRSFYPTTAKVQQQVDWDDSLPSLTQYDAFQLLVQEILDHALKMKLFHQGAAIFKSITKTLSRLDSVERDVLRTSIFRVSGFGAENFTVAHDKIYDARDRQHPSMRGRRAFEAARLILRDDAAPYTPLPNLMEHLLAYYFNRTTVSGTRHIDISSLQFDSKWLEDTTKHVNELWCSLCAILPGSSESGNDFEIMTWLGTLAYATSTDMHVVQALAMMYRIPEFGTIRFPTADKFDLSKGSAYDAKTISQCRWEMQRPFKQSEEANIARHHYETNYQHSQRISTLFDSRQNSAFQEVQSVLKAQWPVSRPSKPQSEAIDTYLDVDKGMPSVLEAFKSWTNNASFLQCLEEFSKTMAKHKFLPIPRLRKAVISTIEKVELGDKRHPSSIEEIFATQPLYSHEQQSGLPTLELLPDHATPASDQWVPTPASTMRARLEDLCSQLLLHAQSRCEVEYVTHLLNSCVALEEHVTQDQTQLVQAIGYEDNIARYLQECNTYFHDLQCDLEVSADNNGCLSHTLALTAQVAPRLSPILWLGRLRVERFRNLSEPWKKAIVEFGVAVTTLQRARRLASLAGKPVDLAEELKHDGHSNWEPYNHPETLLLEAENDIMIREEQEVIASHMRAPEGGGNTVVQLLMGGGKSTVIVPIVAVSLADEKKVVVAKPQSKQMAQMLVSKLGGLLNRRVYYLPFSRDIKLSKSAAEAIDSLLEECRMNKGVLMVQPEHLLSFKLMATEMILTGDPDLAKLLLKTQQHLDNISRDIVDESDENFSPKFELVYTMGTQRPIEFSPQRWMIIQEVLGFLPKIAEQIKNKFPEAIEIQDQGDARFPRIRILRGEAAEELLTLLSKHILEHGVSELPCRSQTPALRGSIMKYIREPELTMEDVREVEESRFWAKSTIPPLLLLRGLIAGGILRFTLGTKRWRVNYGLDPNRIPKTSLAVPYKSKDCPAGRSEFGHPEVVITLTLLSYYYGGLSDSQLFDAFHHLIKSDHASIKYSEWVKTASPQLPDEFRQLSGISIRDKHQCTTEVFPGLRFSKRAIDYYLSFLVFPAQLREFPEKLSASGWDIGAIKRNPTTGFSGTNDTSHLLPLDVQQLDLPSQNYTNALVLGYLQQPENTVELLPANERGSDAEHLLTVIQNLASDVRVILDCGASILQHDNRQVAEMWLQMRANDVQAVVFFDDEELSVLDHTGHIEPFQTSSFSKQLDACLVYLDEAHTRGTDLKLPRNYRAAVTLGSLLTKDKLTQACMRMRKLGHGQSVVFIVPEEISNEIRLRREKHHSDPIEVNDVLIWSIQETWKDLKRTIPLWAVQGEKFERNRHVLNGLATTKEDAMKCLEQESQDLDSLYRPRTERNESHIMNWDFDNPQISQIVSRCRDFNALEFGAASLSEEQERELAPEIQQEFQTERIPNMPAARHELSEDLWELVHNGWLETSSDAFMPAFKSLSSTSAGKLFDLSKFPSRGPVLLVTADFARTIDVPKHSRKGAVITDSFQRPVQYVLSVPNYGYSSTRRLVIISPYEANKLLPTIRYQQKVTLHIFSARTNSAIESLDKLDLYNVGLDFEPYMLDEDLIMQLNLFAGSLYLRSFWEYGRLCQCLGLLRTTAQEGQQASPDGFMGHKHSEWGLMKSPTLFLKLLLTKIRRNGEAVSLTHLGKILGGEQLSEEDFPDT
ncbi:hypothetical protein IQ07DRAFT_566433 [Pyrenochaeta sp. DS3sAY3a]|nr:hypothetical protein IQ07DRAFT_566433 [Pyrenochaeta sp. DS3sAY3a]